MRLPSSKEAHVRSPHTVVGVPDAGEHPLGPGLSAAVRAEEVEENGGVERADGLLAEVIVVRLNLGAPVVVGALRCGPHQARVGTRKITQGQVLVLQFCVADRSNEAIELLFLVADTVFFDDDVSSKVLEQFLAEGVISGFLSVVFSVNLGFFVFLLGAGVDVSKKLLHFTLFDVMELLRVNFIVSRGILVVSSKAVLLGNFAVLFELLLSGTELITGDLGKDLRLHGGLGIHESSTGREKGLETLFSVDNIRVALIPSNTSHDLIILEGRKSVNEGKRIEDRLAMLSIVHSLQFRNITVHQVVVDFLLGFGDLLEGLIELVHNLDVASLNSFGKVGAALVKSLELTGVGHSTDVVISVVQVFGLTDFQVEVDLSVGVKVVKLDLVAHEFEDLVLDLITVHQSLLTHSEPLGHANSPLNLVCFGTRKRIIILSATYLAGRSSSRHDSTGDGLASTTRGAWVLQRGTACGGSTNSGLTCPRPGTVEVQSSFC